MCSGKTNWVKNGMQVKHKLISVIGLCCFLGAITDRDFCLWKCLCFIVEGRVCAFYGQSISRTLQAALFYFSWLSCVWIRVLSEWMKEWMQVGMDTAGQQFLLQCVTWQAWDPADSGLKLRVWMPENSTLMVCHTEMLTLPPPQGACCWRQFLGRIGLEVKSDGTNQKPSFWEMCSTWECMKSGLAGCPMTS